MFGYGSHHPDGFGGGNNLQQSTCGGVGLCRSQKYTHIMFSIVVRTEVYHLPSFETLTLKSFRIKSHCQITWYLYSTILTVHPYQILYVGIYWETQALLASEVINYVKMCRGWMVNVTLALPGCFVVDIFSFLIIRKVFKKHRENRKTLPREHRIRCQMCQIVLT